MQIGFIIGFLLVLAVAFCLGFVVFKQAKARQGLGKSAKGISIPLGIGERVALIIGCVLLIALFLVPPSFHTVDTGEIAVVKHLGEAKGVRTSGTYFDFWLTETYEIYDARVQNSEITTAAYSKDAQTMDVVMTIQWQIDSSKAVEIANKYGNLSTLGNRIQSVSIEKAKSVLSNYSAMSIIETRSSISPEVEAKIKQAIDENYYVDIVAVVLVNIDFSDAFEATVENKMIAEQEKLKAEYEKETAIVNAEKELEVAKLNAQAKLAQAEADAEAQIKIAEAEAEAIKLKSIEVARSLGFKIDENDITLEDGTSAKEYEINFEGKSADEIKLISEYLKYLEYLNKWDGKLPSVMTDNGGTIVVPTPTP